MHRGYVKLWRKTRDSGFNCVQLGFWSYCLLEAVHSPCTRMVGSTPVQLEPGQFVFGRKRWAEALGLSEKVVRNCIKSFLDNDQIRASKRASRYTVFEVVNWGIYQVEDEEQGQQKGQHGASKRASKRASTGPAKKQTSSGGCEQLEKVEGQQRASKGATHNSYSYKNKNKNINTFSSDSDEVKLASLLLSFIKGRNPNHRTPNIQTWAAHVDRMIRLDKRTPEEIEKVIRWSQVDTFWQNNILSTEKLRKQFDTLWLKMQPAGQQGAAYEPSGNNGQEWPDPDQNRWIAGQDGNDDQDVQTPRAVHG